MEGGCLGALLSGAPRVKEEPECALTDRDIVKEEAELQNLDIECMKEESSCEDAASSNEVSEAALASLYLDHVVKDELVLGPEDFHRMNIADTLRGATKVEDRGINSETHTTHGDRESDEEIYNEVNYDREPRCDICGRRFTLKSDLMKHVIIHIYMSSTEMEDELGVGGNGRAPGCNPGEEERLSPRETRAQPDGEPHTEPELYTRVDYDREPICDICGSRFALKTDLMKHVVVHIHMAVSAELEEGMLLADAKKTLNIADGCAQPVARARSSRHALRDCCVRLERLPALERRAPPHAPPPRPPHTLHNTPHDNAETYICDTCSKIFQQKQDLIRHIPRHTQRRLLPKNQGKIEKRPYSCICGKTFKYKQQLKSHNRIHTGETPYSCDICGKEFAHSSSLVSHKRLHTGEKPYSCKICLKRFIQATDLKTHSRTHTGEKPYSCSTCKKQFSSKSNCNTHTLKHKKEYLYPCEVCEKRFLTSSDLRLHNKRTHEGFSCEICSEHFVSEESFKIHKRSVHNTGGPLYTCNVCKMKFVNSFKYKRHKLIHTGERPHSCEICGKRFTRLAHLQSHIRYHTGEKRYSCDICGKQFVEKYTLVCHERTQHTGEKPYSCDVCQKRFTQKTHLNIHKRIHTGEKPYTCELCNKRFTTSGAVKSHRRVHSDKVV